MTQNLPENWLYTKLPLGVISQDERGLMRALLGGFQDSVDSLRAHARKFDGLVRAEGAQESANNVVLVDLLSPEGVYYTRSLDVLPDTPAAGTEALSSWALAQLKLEPQQIANVRYGTDLLRLVTADTRDFLAASIGAVLHQTAAVVGGESSAVKTRILSSYFPRLKVKGTAQSFEILGRILGFTDAAMTPLFGRLSAHLPNDAGSGLNASDYRAVPDFIPQQELGPSYDPHKTDDGPFYEWSGTLSGTVSDSAFVPQVVNGFQPFVRVSAPVAESGSVEVPADGVYTLAGGGPQAKAQVVAGGFTFQALADGESFNGLKLEVTQSENGRFVLTMLERLSSIKYRSSFFDLALGTSIDEPGSPDAASAPSSRSELVFGTSAIRSNPDLRAHPDLTPDGTARSPYRPWSAGTITAGYAQDGFLVQTSLMPVVANGTDAFDARVQASGTLRQHNTDAIIAAGAQAASAMDEVRPATRFPLRVGAGFVTSDEVVYAKYRTESSLSGTTGYATGYPLSPYRVEFSLVNGSVAQSFQHEVDAYDPALLHVKGSTATGTYAYSNQHFSFSFPSGLPPGAQIVAHWMPTSTEVVRSEPESEMTVVGIVGDPHQNNAGQRAVAGMILDWNPHAIVVVGDSGMPTAADNIADAMAPYVPYRDAGKLFSAIGDHDYSSSSSGTSLTEYSAFYSNLPGNGRYYSKRVGEVELFVYNMGWNSDLAAALNQSATLEPDGIDALSVQATAIKNAMAASTARWKLVFVHFEPYGSALVGASRYPGYYAARLPWKTWGADMVFSGHIHAYERVIADGLHYVTCGWSGHPHLLHYEQAGPLVPGSVVRFPVEPQDAEHGGVRVSATANTLIMEARTASGRLVDAVRLTKDAQGLVDYQERPEDDTDVVEVSSSGSSLYTTLEVADDYPWRRDIVAGGEDVDAGTYITTEDDAGATEVSQATAVPDQTGVDYDVSVIDSISGLPRVVFSPRPYDADYAPGQPSIGYSGAIKDVATYTSEERALQNSKNDAETAFSAGFGLYHVGLVNGVLVADPQKFNRDAHRRGLVGWLPFNEHVDDDLAPVDRVVAGSAVVISGVRPEHRQWDNSHGWYLQLVPEASVSVTACRSASDDFSMSVWLMRAPDATAGVSAILSIGPVSVDLDGTSGMVQCYVTDLSGSRQLVGSYALAGTFKQFTLRKTSTSAYFGQGDLLSPIVETGWLGDLKAFTPSDDALLVSGGCGIRDLRIWNAAKTLSDLNAVRLHAPQQTVATYRVGVYRTLNRGDRVALRVLPNGFATPATLPPHVREPKLKRIRRYDSMGRFHGESRFREVGLGGGRSPGSLAVPLRLGSQFTNVTAAGTTVAASDIGNMPGVNSAWLRDRAAGQYVSVTTGTFVPKESVWRYLDDGTDKLSGTPYYAVNYDDSAWKSGAGYFGYGQGDQKTTLYYGPSPSAKYVTSYFRRTFVVSDLSNIGPLELGLRRDDGVVVYINGTEVARQNMAAGAYSYLTLANGSAAHDSAYYTKALAAAVLRSGTNYIAADVHQASAASDDLAFDAYLITTSNGTGGVTNLLSTASGTWPQAMVETNPNRDSVWVRGDDSYVYEVRLNGNSGSTAFVAERVVRGYTDAEIDLFGTSFGTRYVEQPTGAETVLSSNGTVLAVAYGGTNVYQKATSGTLTTPPLFMYLDSRVVENVTDAYTRWNEAGNTLLYGERQTPKVAARDTNGALEFIGNMSVLQPGYYELTVDSGNLGNPDADFDGFAVEISVDALVLQKRLLVGKTGQDVRGTDRFEFYFPDSVSSEWVLSLRWTNAFADAAKNQFRRLAVYGYSLRRLETELWRAAIGASAPVLTQLDTRSYSAATPGGWLVSLNSYGTVVQHRHESQVYPSGDTVTSRVPLSSLLTATTAQRREDILMTANGTNPDFIPSEDAALVLPSFGTVSEAPAIPASFVWSGGYEQESRRAVVTVKMVQPTAAVRLAYAPSSQWPAGAAYTPFAAAGSESQNVAKFVLEDLQPHTRYYYAASSGTLVDYNTTGTLTTWGTEPFSFQFVATACVQNQTASVQNGTIFDVIRALNPLMLLNVGDLNYNDSVTASDYTAAMELPFTAARQARLLRSCSVDWTWDDHDYGASEGCREHTGKSAAWEAYRRYAPHYALPAGDEAPIYHAFTVGNCRFICSDTRSDAHPVGYAGSDKSRLGRAQKEWLKSELLLAKGSYGAIFWVNPDPWIAVSSSSDDWGSYATERAEIAQFIYDNGIKGVFILSGDMHAQALDDGRNSKYALSAPDAETPYVTASGTAVGGLPVFHVAPLYQSASQKGGPYWKGPHPASGSATTERFGLVTVTVDGDHTYVGFSARDAAGAAVSDVFHTFNGTESPKNT